MPSDIAEPKTYEISLPAIVIFVGGLTPLDGFPQHNIPYDNGEELPPPGSNILEIILFVRGVIDAKKDSSLNKILLSISKNS